MTADHQMGHPLDENDTRSRLDRIESDVAEIRDMARRAEHWIIEWVGSNGVPGLRQQVIDALRERQAAKIGATILKWSAAVGASGAAIWAVLHEIFKR